MTDIMLTRNTDKLRQVVAAHVAADTIVQEIYWDSENNRGCFFGCLAKSNNPKISEVTYGLPVMVQRIAENIFEALSTAEAKAFFAALPDAVNCDGKDLTKVGWQFLAAELRSLPNCTDQVQAVIDPVITGMDLLASGQEWATAATTATTAAAWAAHWVDGPAAATAVHGRRACSHLLPGQPGSIVATTAATTAATAAAAAAWVNGGTAATARAAAAVTAAHWVDGPAAATAVTAAAAATAAATAATAAAAVWVNGGTAAAWVNGPAAVRLRQRDLLLRLISEAPVVEAHQ